MALDVKSLEGKEIAVDYVRKAQTRGRWGETWDVFKGSFGKVVLINLLMLLFLLPAVGIFIYRWLFIAAQGLAFPFNANTGIGYPAYPDVLGMTESIYMYADLISFSVLVACGFIASVGLSGGAYSLKKLLNTHGKFTFKGFFRGVKSCYLRTVVPVTVFLIFLFATVVIGDWKDLVISTGGSGAGPITAYVFIIIATVLAGIYCAWMLAVGVSYRISFSKVLKSAISLIIASPIQTIFFLAFALLPLWLFFIGMAVPLLQFIVYFILILFGLSYIVLVWMSFTQWVFDMFITPEFAKEEGNKKSAKLPQEVEEDARSSARELLASGKSELLSKPYLPVSDKTAVKTLDNNYTRADFAKLSEQKQKLKEEISAYEKAHINDSVYAEYNKMFEDRDKALQTPSNGKKGNKKRVSADNLLRN